jgi:hypothetical protein
MLLWDQLIRDLEKLQDICTGEPVTTVEDNRTLIQRPGPAKRVCSSASAERSYFFLHYGVKTRT